MRSFCCISFRHITGRPIAEYLPIGLDLMKVSHTEKVHYTDAAFPRYTGEIAARTLTNGGRYDYRYDAYDRLIAADYTPAETDSVGEDFSAAYSYDAIGRPCSIQRYGVTGIDGSTEKFGLLDGLIYSYDGALPSSISRDSEAVPYFGQTGATGTTLSYNKAGLLLTDTGRGVESTVYNRLGLPREIEISPGRFAIKNFEKRLYSMSGSLISVSEFIDGYPAPVQTGKRTYIDRFTFTCGSDGVDTLMRVDFPGGYFDSAGVHWMLPDAIGSVGLVIDGNGNVEQHTGYYPYGEPWREPAGQPYLFGGKERRRFAGLGDYDFHARFLTTSTALWQAPDLHAGNRPWLSPWVFCAANPIKYVDPTGMDTFVIQQRGNIIDQIKVDEYDSIIMILDDATEKESPRLPAGTILDKKNEPIKEGKSYTYFEVNGDDNGTTIFQFLVANANVEYSQLKCTTTEISELNYIGTSHKDDNDQAAGMLINNKLKNDGTIIREHIHSHPSGLLWPSDGDKEFAYGVKVAMKQNIVFKVYTTQAYNGLGNYVQYDEKTPKLTPQEFREEYKPINR